MSFIKRHSLAFIVLGLGLLSLAFFIWADWHQFVSDAQQHHQTVKFWSLDFLAHFGDNAAQNWQSELLFGVLLILILRDAGADDPAA